MEGWGLVPFVQCVESVETPIKIPRKQFKKSGQFPIVSQEKDLINGYWCDESSVVSVDSPLIVFGDHTKVLKFIDFDFVVGADGVKLLKPKPFLNAKYFYYFLMANSLADLGYARHYRLLKELKVEFPQSISKQKQIVAILDKAFAAIETATANTKKNLANARELFESQLERAFAGKTDSEGWQELKIKDVVQPLTTVNPRKNPSLPFKYIDVSSVSRSSYLIEETATLLGSYAPSRARRRVQSGDVIFATIRPTLQRISIVPEHLDGSICSTGYYVLRSGKKIVNRFLFYYLLSRTFDEEMATLQRGTAYPAVSDRDVKEHIIPFPPLPEQKRIVKILDKLSAETRSLSDIYNTKLNALAELKQALLHKSFCGEL